MGDMDQMLCKQFKNISNTFLNKYSNTLTIINMEKLTRQTYILGIATKFYIHYKLPGIKKYHMIMAAYSIKP